MASRPVRTNRVYRKVANDIRSDIAERRTQVAAGEVAPAAFTTAARTLAAHLAIAEAVIAHQPARRFCWRRRTTRPGPSAD